MRMLEQWHLARAGVGYSTAQYNQQLWLVPFRVAVMAVVTCGWEFLAETTRSTNAWRTIPLILPQLVLLAVIVLRFLPVLKHRTHRFVAVTSGILAPMLIVTVIHSGFQMSIGLCCCSRLFCPITIVVDVAPDTASCGLVVNNCYMAFIRKIAHFYGTVTLLSSLSTIIFEMLTRTTQRISGRQHCLDFMTKTRLQ